MFVCADRKYRSLVYSSLPSIFDNKRAFLIYKSLFKNSTKVITLLTSLVVNSSLLVKVKSPGHIVLPVTAPPQMKDVFCFPYSQSWWHFKQ